MSLSTDAIITVTSTIITLASMALTLYAAWQVKGIKDQITIDIRRVNINQASRSLERTLGEIRKLQDSKSANSRGRGRTSTIEAVQSQFDLALMQIDVEGPDCDVRDLISKAQSKLQKLRSSSSDDDCAETTSEMQSLVQDAISLINGRSFRLEGKA